MDGWTCCGGHQQSPTRASIRAASATALEEQAGRMRKRAELRDGHGEVLQVGTVVQLALDNVDRAKMDFYNATLVVVQQVGVGALRVANRAGVYQIAPWGLVIAPRGANSSSGRQPRIAPRGKKYYSRIAIWSRIAIRGCVKIAIAPWYF